MLTVAELESMRSTAEMAMPDTVTIRRPSTTAPILNPATATLDIADPDVIYTGKARLAAPTSEERESVFTDIEITSRTLFLTIPVSAAPLVADDEVTVDSSATDPHLAGTVLRVIVAFATSFAVSRRVVAEIVD